MQLAIKFIGVAIIVLTFIFLLRIDLVRSLLRYFARGSGLYIAAVIRIIVAVLLIFGAGSLHGPRMWIIFAIGIIFLLSGIAIFTLKPATFRKLLDWYQRRSDLFLRLTVAIGVIIGGLIVYAV